MNDRLKWIWLSLKCGPANTEFLKLWEKFKDINTLYEADYDDYTRAGVSEHLCEMLSDKSLTLANSISTFCRAHNSGYLCYTDDNYPKSLRALSDPPIVLYYAGELPNFNDELCISVVGTRKMSEYGMRAAYKISYEMAAAGAVIVSGMALGIDGVASCGAISAKGRTVAVLGCGIDVVYPKAHTKLEDIIKKHGAVITEYPPSTEPRAYNFPVRNRIISGISQGTVVVDADIDSGAMITAKKAILQGKDIYAVPGNIDGENTLGTNSLIRDGATAVLCGRDVIKNYAYLYGRRIDMARLMRAERESEFDPRAVERMGIGVRVFVPSKDGERIETELDQKRRASRVPEVIEDKNQVEKTKLTEIKKKSPKPRKSAFDETRQNEASTFEEKKGDSSSDALSTLNEKQKRIFEEIPLDRAVTVDALIKLGYSMGEIMSSLTVLEIKGLISSLPGALYIRK